MKPQKPIYIVVRVDVEYDENVINENEVVQEAVSQFDYDFKLKEDTGMKVVDTEICGINPVLYD